MKSKFAFPIFLVIYTVALVVAWLPILNKKEIINQEYKMDCTAVWETEYSLMTRCENPEVICYKLNRNSLQCKFKTR